jgi:hypothetical protein
MRAAKPIFCPVVAALFITIWDILGEAFKDTLREPTRAEVSQRPTSNRIGRSVILGSRLTPLSRYLRLVRRRAGLLART